MGAGAAVLAVGVVGAGVEELPEAEAETTGGSGIAGSMNPMRIPETLYSAWYSEERLRCMRLKSRSRGSLGSPGDSGSRKALSVAANPKS